MQSDIIHITHHIHYFNHEYAPVVTEAKWDQYEIYNFVFFTSSFTNFLFIFRWFTLSKSRWQENCQLTSARIKNAQTTTCGWQVVSWCTLLFVLGTSLFKKLMPNISWQTFSIHYSSLAPSKIAYVEPHVIDVLIVNFLIPFEYFNGSEAHSISQTPGTRS